MTDLFAALGLVFVIEGIVFAAFPQGAKRSMAAALDLSDRQLRIIGLASAIVGIVIVWLVRG